MPELKWEWHWKPCAVCRRWFRGLGYQRFDTLACVEQAEAIAAAWQRRVRAG